MLIMRQAQLGVNNFNKVFKAKSKTIYKEPRPMYLLDTLVILGGLKRPGQLVSNLQHH